MKFTPARLLTIVLFLITTACAFFVWPTRYRYDHLKIGQNSFPVKIDRITGNTKVLYPTGWVAKEIGNEELPTNQISQLKVEGALLDGRPPRTESNLIKQYEEEQKQRNSDVSPVGAIEHSLLEVEIYNGTQEEISEVTVEVFTGYVRDGSSQKTEVVSPDDLLGVPSVSRIYRLTPTLSQPVLPLSSAKFSAVTGIKPTLGQSWTLRVVSAKCK